MIQRSSGFLCAATSLEEKTFAIVEREDGAMVKEVKETPGRRRAGAGCRGRRSREGRVMMEKWCHMQMPEEASRREVHSSEEATVPKNA